MQKKIITSIITVLVIIGISVILILQGKGYRLDIKHKKLDKTGIIAVSSLPSGAAVYLNGHLTAATNTNLSDLDPGEYHIKVTKEGYIPWEKVVTVEAEIVTPVEITLFPSVADLSPLTYAGVIKPQLSSDGQKVVYALKSGEKSGLWILDLASRPLIFSKEPKQIAKDSTSLGFSDSLFSWAPDSKTVLSVLQENSQQGAEFTRTYLLSVDQLNNDRLTDITNTIGTTQNIWKEDALLKNQDRLARLQSESARTLASASSSLIWSPDETKFLATSSDSVHKITKVTVYDSKKDKSYEFPVGKTYLWYPDSRHFIVVEDKALSIEESTGENSAVVYNGNFEPSVVFPWPDGSKLLIATNFNTAIKDPNLYTINLR